jgi:hypothetical protein
MLLTQLPGRLLTYRLRTLLLFIAGSALVCYALLPGHLLPCSVNVEYQLLRLEHDFESDSKEGWLVAMIHVTNSSRGTLCFRGTSRKTPDFQTYQLRRHIWKYVETSTEPSQPYLLKSGESIIFRASVFSDATAVRVGIIFASRWWGPMDTLAMSDPIDISSQLRQMEEADLKR